MKHRLVIEMEIPDDTPGDLLNEIEEAVHEVVDGNDFFEPRLYWLRG